MNTMNLSNTAPPVPNPSSTWPTRYSPEMLRHIGKQVESLMSRHSSLKMHKQAIERQLAAIAARISEHDAVLLPRSVFLLLEMRGSGGVSAQLEQIARIVHEQGYWKPPGHVPNYHQQDVYRLGKSAQRLFDDYAALDGRVEQVHGLLGDIKQRMHLAAETTPQGVLDTLAAGADILSVQGEVDMIVDLLQAADQPRWFRWLFVCRRFFSPSAGRGQAQLAPSFSSLTIDERKGSTWKSF